MLRRFAQTNHATTSAHSSASPSPKTKSTVPADTPSTPSKGGQRTAQSAPRARVVHVQSPLLAPSISASTPFDWEAARARLPPPYATPTKRGARGRESLAGTPLRGGPPKQKVVRKKSLMEKITSLPSEIVFYWEVSSAHIELVTPEKAAWAMGGLLHFLHFCVRVAQIRKIPDSDLGWEDMYREDEGESWFDWTVPMTILLFGAALANTLYLFTRTRLYQFYLASDPLASPNAKYIPRASSSSPSSSLPSSPSYPTLALHATWRALVLCMRFLLNLSPPKDQQTIFKEDRVQVIEKWDPQEFEMTLFCVYSPVHGALWLALTSANWIWVCVIMGLVSVQTRALVRSFQILLKDTKIIQSEVMHEYDTKFVNPRIHPVRRDAAVMTHQAEMVDS